jgi:hypothetical protein
MLRGIVCEALAALSQKGLDCSVQVEQLWHHVLVGLVLLHCLQCSTRIAAQPPVIVAAAVAARCVYNGVKSSSGLSCFEAEGW